jgi:MinD-like ATPase involved in chromosome partitioning or flagellar assembly
VESQQRSLGQASDKIIIVTGSKGGVGTMTVALNLASQLAMQARQRVGLLDLARPFGRISLMLDLEPRFTILDALERIDRLDEALLATMAMRHKSGIEILAGPLHAPMKAEQRQSVTLATLTQLVEIAGRAFEFTVIDMGVVNAAEWAPVRSHARTLLLVAEPNVLALSMIARHISVARPSGVDCERSPPNPDGFGGRVLLLDYGVIQKVFVQIGDGHRSSAYMQRSRISSVALIRNPHRITGAEIR